MNRSQKPKFLLVVFVAAVGAACAQPTGKELPPNTARYLLDILVQIAVHEDLADYKRIGELLKIDVVMITDEPKVMQDGQSVSHATASDPKNPGYLSAYSNFYYGITYAPKRAATLSLTFNNPKTCININDVYPAFHQHGSLNQLPAPSQVPPPPGTSYPPVKKDQSVYAYAFRGKRTGGSMTFAYTNCLSSINFHQPSGTY